MKLICFCTIMITVCIIVPARAQDEGGDLVTDHPRDEDPHREVEPADKQRPQVTAQDRPAVGIAQQPQHDRDR